MVLEPLRQRGALAGWEERDGLAAPPAPERVPADPQGPRVAQAYPRGPAQGAATVGRRAVKRRRRQGRVRHNHWRTRSWRRTRSAAQGRAARVRA